MADDQQVGFDPDAFHQQFVSSQGATPFDPDEFHAKYASQAQPDAIGKQSKAAAIAAGVQNPGVSTPPLKPAMEAAGAKHEANEERLAELEHHAMQTPTPVTNAATGLFPAAELPEALASGGIKAVAKGVARGLGKTAIGAGTGSVVGAGVGSVVGHPGEGAQIGATVGGLGAPFAPDAWFARAPYGINRIILGEQGLASERAASKVAQRDADIAAGLRKAPAGPEPSMTPVGATSTAPGAVAALPKEALPGIAKGATSSTGAMPTQPLGTKPAPPSMIAGTPTRGPQGTTPMELPAAGSVPQPKEVQLTPKAAAIKQGVTTAAEVKEPNFTGSEGRPATWTNERVNELAREGNRDAIAQKIRRGMELAGNERYVMGAADYPRAVLNPREVTKFTPEGTPIRNAENPIAQSPSSRARIAQPQMPAARPEPPEAEAPVIVRARPTMPPAPAEAPTDYPKPWGLNDIGPNGEIPDELTDFAQRFARSKKKL